MAKVEIYTWQFCPLCLKAKALLEQKGVNYIEHSIDGDQAAREDMAHRSEGRSTVPQIFIDDNGIGGCDDLYELARSNDLNDLLGLMN